MLDPLAAGSTSEEIEHEYGITPEDVQACIAYGSEMARDPRLRRVKLDENLGRSAEEELTRQSPTASTTPTARGSDSRVGRRRERE